MAGYAGALFILRGRGIAIGALGGFAFGSAMFGMLLSWSARFGVPALAGLVSSQALFFIPFGAAAGARSEGWRWVATTTGALTIAEATRARWPLGGFEWGQLGYVWHATPLRGLASTVGVLGLTALTIATCALAAAVVRRQVLPGGGALLAVVVFAVMISAVAARQWTTPAGGLDVAVVQVAPVCDGPVVRCPREDVRIRNAFARATSRSDARPSLFIWGEGALGGDSIERLGRRASGLRG